MADPAIQMAPNVTAASVNIPIEVMPLVLPQLRIDAENAVLKDLRDCYSALCANEPYASERRGMEIR